MAQSKPKSCLDYAMHYLYRYPKTEKEMRTQLMKKWYFLEDIDHAMTSLKQKWYIDDRQFAELYLNSEVVKKGKPLALITQKLYHKGIDKDIVRHMVQQLWDGIADGTIDRIIKEIDKYSLKEVDPVAMIHKLIAKWYKLDDIKKALKKRKWWE